MDEDVGTADNLAVGFLVVSETTVDAELAKKAPHDSLRGYLAAEQARRSLDDHQFAALLGISAMTWRALTRSTAPWPATVLARVLVRFPDALTLATAELRLRVEPGDGWRHWHPASSDSLRATCSRKYASSSSGVDNDG